MHSSHNDKLKSSDHLQVRSYVAHLDVKMRWNIISIHHAALTCVWLRKKSVHSDGCDVVVIAGVFVSGAADPVINVGQLILVKVRWWSMIWIRGGTP